MVESHHWQSACGEMCALRWTDRERRPSEPSVLRVARALYYDDDGNLAEKDTKTHQQRGLVLDPETDTVLDELEARTRQRSEAVGVGFNPAGYMFSPVPDGSRPQDLTLVSKRYARLAKRLGIDTSIKNMRHHNATVGRLERFFQNLGHELQGKWGDPNARAGTP